MSEELKPCPFCREVPSLELKHELSLYKGCITCPKCGVSIEMFFETKRECVEDILAIWNSRPIEDALRARVEELEAALNDIQCLSPAVAYTSPDSKVIELDYSDYCDYCQKIKELTEVALKKKEGEK